MRPRPATCATAASSRSKARRRTRTTAARCAPRARPPRQYVYHEDRLRTPLKRVGPRGSGEFAPISWDEALDTVVANLERLGAESGPESVVFYVGYPKQPRPFVQRLALQFGSPNFCTESSTCFTATAMAFRLVYGQLAMPDLRNARVPAGLERQPLLLQHHHGPAPVRRTRPRSQADRGRPPQDAARLARRHPPAAQARHRRRARSGHGPRHHRGGPLRPRVRGRPHAGLRRVSRLRRRVRPRASRADHRRPGREDPGGGQALRHHQTGRPHAERRSRGSQHQRRAELPSRVLADRPDRQLRRARRQHGRALQLARDRRRRVHDATARVRDAPQLGRPAAARRGRPLPGLGRARRPGPGHGPAAPDPQRRSLPSAGAGRLRPQPPHVPRLGGLPRGHSGARLHLRRRPVRHRLRALRRHRPAGLQLGRAQRAALLPREVRRPVASRRSPRWASPARTPTSSSIWPAGSSSTTRCSTRRPTASIAARCGVRGRPRLDPRAERHDRGPAQGASRRHGGARSAARA